MKTFFKVLLILTILFLQPARSALAVVGGPDQERYSLDYILVNECNGEDIHLTGNVLYFLRYEEKRPSGTWGYVYQGIFQNMTGIGLTSGIRYKLINISHIHISGVITPDIPDHFAWGTSGTFHLVSQGGSPDLLIRAVTRLTITPDGVRRDFTIYNATCM